MTAPLPAVPEREAFEAHFPDWANKPGMASAWVGWEARAHHDRQHNEAIKAALDIAYDLARSSAADMRNRYGNYPLDGLGRRITAADADVATVRAANERVTAAMGVAG